MPIDALRLANLIDTHAVALQLWVRSSCLSCEDVVQEAFTRLALQEPVPDNPVAWLYRVSRNLALKQRLSDSRQRHREQLVAQSEASQLAPDPLELADLRQAIERLDDELREVLVAHLWGQLPLEEIGQLCGISTATAFRRYEAALVALRSMLEPKCENRT